MTTMQVIVRKYEIWILHLRSGSFSMIKGPNFSDANDDVLVGVAVGVAASTLF